MKIAGTSLKPLELWRSDVHLREAREFGSSLLASLARAGAGGRVAGLGPRPTRPLILYAMERCPFSRLVREALSELDLDVIVKPCPPGERSHRGELRQMLGREQVPYLIDHDRGVALSESRAILEHLYECYGAEGRVPRRLRPARLQLASSRFASLLRAHAALYTPPTQRPGQPLVLWTYEASPYCRLVRETLDRLGLCYLAHNLARNSPRRAAFAERFGKLQFPLLRDPSTDTLWFETAAINAYLLATYGALDGAPAAPGSLELAPAPH